MNFTAIIISLIVLESIILVIKVVGLIKNSARFVAGNQMWFVESFYELSV